MALEEPEEEDLKINVKGYDFIMDKELEEAYGQFTVGYSNSFLRKGFVITQDRGGGSC